MSIMQNLKSPQEPGWRDPSSSAPEDCWFDSWFGAHAWVVSLGPQSIGLCAEGY